MYPAHSSHKVSSIENDDSGVLLHVGGFGYKARSRAPRFAV